MKKGHNVIDIYMNRANAISQSAKSGDCRERKTELVSWFIAASVR